MVVRVGRRYPGDLHARTRVRSHKNDGPVYRGDDQSENEYGTVQYFRSVRLVRDHVVYG